MLTGTAVSESWGEAGARPARGTFHQTRGLCRDLPARDAPSTAMGLHCATGHVCVHEGLVWTEEQFTPMDVRLRVTPTVGLPLVTITLTAMGASDMKKVPSTERFPE